MAQPSDRPIPLGFASFRRLAETRPATKMGMIVALLPEIEQLLRRGHKAKDIWRTLKIDGLALTYEVFRVYLRRARRKFRQSYAPIAAAPPRVGERPEVDVAKRVANSRIAEVPQQHQSAAMALHVDPFEGIRRSRSAKARERFDYDPLAPLKEDLLR
jgi:hypothetical protein